MDPSMNDTHFDLLLKGGHVIDPANGIDATMDVGIIDGKIALRREEHPRQRAAQNRRRVRPLSSRPASSTSTRTSTPSGRRRQPTSAASNADAHLLASGVTTTVDAGTAGWKDFTDFKEGCIDKAKVRILAFINIAARGMVDCGRRAGRQHVAAQNRGRAGGCLSRHPRRHQDRPLLDAAALGCGAPAVGIGGGRRRSGRAVRQARDGRLLAAPAGTPLPRPDPGETAPRRHPHACLRAAVPHRGRGRQVYDHMFKARERGVIFDLGHGAGSFWFRNAVPALAMASRRTRSAPTCTWATSTARGEYDHDDVEAAEHRHAAERGDPPFDRDACAGDQPPRPRHVESGRRSRYRRHPALEGRFGYSDCGRAKIVGNEKLECAMTVKAGDIVYDPTGLSMPEWHDAPAVLLEAAGSASID